MREFANRERVEGITIDPPGALDLDDAIHLQFRADRVTAIVSVADVAATVLPGSAEDLSAYGKAFSSYYAGYTKPMLPRELSEDSLSLLSGKKRLTQSIYVDLDKTLGIAAVNSRQTFIVSPKQWSYATYTQEINNGNQTAAKWHHLAKSLLEKRKRDGALFIYDSQNGLSLDEEGNLVFVKEGEHKAQVLVQELMILANRAWTLFAVENDIPILFRNHRELDGKDGVEKDLAHLLALKGQGGGKEEIKQVEQRVEQTLSRAEYGATCLGHCGLNVPMYATFTSPIRRYADTINQRQVGAFLQGAPLPYSRDDLERFGNYLNMKYREVKEQKSEALRGAVYEKALVAVIRAEKGKNGDEVLSRENVSLALKHYAKNQTCLPQALSIAVLKQIHDKSICVEDLHSILVRAPKDIKAWRRLQNNALALLEKTPFVAVNLINMSCQKDPQRWTEPSYRENKVENGVLCEVNITVDGRNLTTQGSLTGNKKSAKASAALAFWHLYLDKPVPQHVVQVVSEKPGLNGVKQKIDDPLSLLNTFCQVKGLTKPKESVQQKGPSHAPTFLYELELSISPDREPFLAFGRAGSKKEAKAQAAQYLLKKLANAGACNL